MKTILLLLSLAAITGAAELTFTVPDNQVPRVLEAFEGVKPIPTDTNDVPLYTPAQWARKSIIDYVKRTVRRWEQKKAMNQIPQAEVDSVMQ